MSDDHRIRVLYVDDYPLDRELVRDALTKESSGFELFEAASRSEFETALANKDFDLVLSDFNILGFEGLQVLHAIHTKNAEIPVIIVTGTGSEEIAVEAMKQGAADYVIKKYHHIQRLPLTIHAVLEKKRIEQEKRESEELYRILFENSGEAILLTDPDGTIHSANPEACRIFQMQEKEINKLGRQGLVDPTDPRLPDEIEQRGKSGKFRGELNLVRKDGTIFPAEISTTVFKDRYGNERTSMIISDITERKQAENKIRRQLDYLSALRLIDQTITSTFDLHVSLNTLLVQTISLLSIDAASILLYNPALHRLHYAVGLGFMTGTIEAAQIKPGEELADRVAVERRLIHIANLNDEPHSSLLNIRLAGENFSSYHGMPLIVKGKVIGVLELFHRSVVKRDQEWLDFLRTLADQAAIAIDYAQLFDNLQKTNLDLSQAYDATIEGWSLALDLRDRETVGHTKRVVEKTLELAKRMELSEAQLTQIYRGAMLHDIGKLGVPDGILLKPGPLNEEEWLTMKKHPVFAFEMLSSIQYLTEAMDIPYCHHEKWDGTGYPRGLKGEKIPLTARIFTVVDVYDALTSDRPYRPAWTKEETREYIQSLAGLQFDPQVVKAFFELIC